MLVGFADVYDDYLVETFHDLSGGYLLNLAPGRLDYLTVGRHQ